MRHGWQCSSLLFTLGGPTPPFGGPISPEWPTTDATKRGAGARAGKVALPAPPSLVPPLSIYPPQSFIYPRTIPFPNCPSIYSVLRGKWHEHHGPVTKIVRLIVHCTLKLREILKCFSADKETRVRALVWTAAGKRGDEEDTLEGTKEQNSGCGAGWKEVG